MCETCGCNITPGNAHLVGKDGKLEHTSEGKASIEVLTETLKKLWGLPANEGMLAKGLAPHCSMGSLLRSNFMSGYFMCWGARALRFLLASA